jgi:hypothetical protein
VVVNHERVRKTVAGGVVALLALDVTLSVVTRDPWATNDGVGLVALIAYAVAGYVIARAQPRNPIGWTFLSLALLTLFNYGIQLYLVLDYREHGGSLPLGAAAVFWRGTWTILPFLVALPAIALFPEGRLTRRWRRLLWAYVAVATVFMGTQCAGQALYGVSGRLVITIRGNISNSSVGGGVAAVGWLLVPLFLVAWCAFVGRQVAAWRSSAGIRRAQLKWFAAGSAVLVASSVLLLLVGDGSSTGSRIAADVAITGIGLLPVTIGVAVLRYRLYEIDRIVSRTLAYALLTALLVGVFAGIVLLTTRVLPFSSPVAVAASTLAAAALFNPLRTRVQRLVDRRFNRARYDRDALVAAFGAKLRDAVDSETVLRELAGAAASAVEPVHVSVWVSS